MKFNPIATAKLINQTYRDYMKSTFFIKDKEFRDAYISEINSFEFAKGPFFECVDAFALGQSLKDLVDGNILSPLFEKLFQNDQIQYQRPLYKHQQDAIYTAVADRNMVVTTGTGSGKTECFIYPILHSLLKENEKGNLTPGVRVLLLYPMNALANDQMQRLRQLLKDYPSITFGSYTGETEEHKSKAEASFKELYPGEEILPNELISRSQMKESPPHILVTNYAMLEYLLIRPADNVFFNDPRFNQFWRYIVLDEAHVYSGASGMEVSILLRRLIHSLPNPNQIRFILTSATLGDDNRNQEIVSFASTLCAGALFTEDSIIRAKRREINFKATFTGNSKLYRNISEILQSDKSDIDKKEAILKTLKSEQINSIPKFETGNLKEMLYNIFREDEMYGKVRETVKGGAIDLIGLVKSLGTSEESLIDFVQIANYSVRDGGKLLDARYHHFIRTLEGAYATFFPKKTLSLQPRNTVILNNKTYRCFKLSVCQFCGESYLEGLISNGRFSQEEGDKRDYFMLITDEFFAFEDDEITRDNQSTISQRQAAAYWLCSSCGAVVKYGGMLPCQCNNQENILIYKCPLPDDQILHQCHYCRTITPRGSILRGFYLGHDASAAVIGESLYSQIPPRQIRSIPINQGQNNGKIFSAKPIERSQKTSRQLLLFADSRQEAAYFASYFQNTYDVVFYRRIIMKAARNLLSTYPDDYTEGIPLTDLGDAMERYLKTEIKIGKKPEEVSVKVWKAIIGELMDLSRNSLRGLGWIDFHLSLEDSFAQRFPSVTNPINEEQMKVLSHIFLQYCLHNGAVHPKQNVQFTETDYQQMVFTRNEPAIKEANTGIEYKGFATHNFIPSTQNKISEYLDRVFSMDKAEQEIFLRAIFEEYLTHPDYRILTPIPKENSLYKVNPEKVRIRVQDFHDLNHFRCDVCGQLTTMNLNNVCPFYRCYGRLHPSPFGNFHSKGYFINQYGPESPIISAIVKEHTAQLSKDRAKEYQRKFINGEINVLSCTTTFEMGVDVGDLETIFMKNVPPRPSNYVQRAGRAGRRTNTAAFSLTFCKLGPHDLYYFHRPTDMINGVILPPKFKIDNPKIVSRHVYAVLLSSYWKQLFPEATKISQFFEKEAFQQIIKFLDAVPSDVQKYLKALLPTSLVNQINGFIKDYKGKLEAAQELFIEDLGEYKEAIEIEKISEKPNKYKILDWWDRAKKAHEEENIITHFSRANLIPKYGFPVDTVTLFTNARSPSYIDSGSTLSLQRDLIQAINEYAPDSEVAADGLLFTSRYIKVPFKKDWAWRLRWVQQCGNRNCGKITVENYSGQAIERKGTCELCHDTNVRSQVMLIPEYGFIIDPAIEPIATKRPKRSQRTEFYYLGIQREEEKLEPKTYNLGNSKLSIISSIEDQLLVMNRSQFLVCRECGYSNREDLGNWGNTKKTHKNPKGSKCHSNILERMALGHIFKTDVVLISIDSHLPYNEALTTLFALLEGCSRYYGIERDDIDGCVSYQSYVAEGGDVGTTLVLFDSVPGGAGNVKRIYDSSREDFLGFLKSSLDRVLQCSCGGDLADMVCYNCLANFKNQYYQHILERRFAINLLSRLLESEFLDLDREF